MVLALLERLFGRRIRLLDVEDVDPERTRQRLERARAEGEHLEAARDGSALVGWGLEADLRVAHDEIEHSEFQAQGVVRTADGRELSFSVGLEMTRAEHEELSVGIRAGDAVKKDPLVLNFDGTAAELTSTRFAFDVDADGVDDQVAFVTGGSGFLALDRNGNGRVDDGSELFGPATGNGFSELASFDEDGNGWIDEGDSVYDRLRVWTKDGSGSDSLATLLQADVGAIYLQSVGTPFQAGAGEIVSSGVFLRESSAPAGTVQQVDLYV